MKNNFKNVILNIFLILSVVFSDSNGAQEGQGGQPPALGWFTVSKVSKIREFCFDYESTKKKRFEKRPNVCKWLKILSKSVSQHPVDHFKLFRSILALKLTELQAFEISNIFGSSSFGRRLKNIEEILSNGYRTAHFSFENFKKVIFWPKSLVFKILNKKSDI
jgi:hypothetical protein